MADQAMTSRAALWFLFREIGGRRIALLAVLLLAASLTEGIGLILLVPLTQLVTGGGPAVGPPWLAELAGNPIEFLLAGFVGLVTLRAGIVYLANEQRRTLGLWLGRELRRKAHAALMGADWRWLARQHSAQHSAMVMSEADRVAGLANQALVILTAIVTLVILLASSALISFSLTLVVAGLGILTGVVVATLRRRGRLDGRAYVAAHVRLQKLVTNGLQHLRAARIASAEKLIEQDFESATGELADIEHRFFRTGHRVQAAMQIAAATLLAALVYVAVVFAALPLAIFLPVLAIAGRVVPLVGAIQQGLRSWGFDLAALDSLQQTIEEAERNRETRQAGGDVPRLTRSIELRDIGFAHQERVRPIFSGFDLKIEARSLVAVTGPSGSGKSTLADLMSGLLSPDSGKILIDDIELDPASRAAWRSAVAYVEQNPFLREVSVAENLTWGGEGFEPDDLRAALVAASAEFVLDLPHGIATPMGEGGRQFSGGENQRIALARALLRKPQLLILDEVTAGLDEDNASAIGRSIEALRGECTVLILGHDARMAEMADAVVKLGQAGPR